jgi:ribosome-binding factor A
MPESPSIRCQKIADVLIREISGILQTELRDPGIGFVTVTGAEVTRDLRSAKVFVSVMGDGPRKQEALRALDRARPAVQNLLGGRIRLRYMPTLRFVLDESNEYGARIDALLERIKEKETKQNGEPTISDHAE